jgi:hypothetical protein
VIPASVSSLMSARVRAGPRFGGLSLEGLSLEDLSPGGPLLGAPPVDEDVAVAWRRPAKSGVVATVELVSVADVKGSPGAASRDGGEHG